MIDSSLDRAKDLHVPRPRIILFLRKMIYVIVVIAVVAEKGFWPSLRIEIGNQQL